MGLLTETAVGRLMREVHFPREHASGLFSNDGWKDFKGLLAVGLDCTGGGPSLQHMCTTSVSM